MQERTQVTEVIHSLDIAGMHHTEKELDLVTILSVYVSINIIETTHLNMQ